MDKTLLQTKLEDTSLSNESFQQIIKLNNFIASQLGKQSYN